MNSEFPSSWARRRMRSGVVAFLTVVAAVTALIVLPAPSASATTTASTSASSWAGNSTNPFGGKDYYVDASAGNDTNNGTSTRTAWKTLTKVNTITFSPGDRILLKAGSTWSYQQLWPKGSGTAAKPITIDAYGDNTAAKPYIATNGHVTSPFTADGTKNPATVGLTGAVVLRNQQYWTIQNLQLSNDDNFASDMVTGNVIRDGVSVSINADLFPAGTAAAATVMHGITVQNLDVHNVDVPNSWQKIYAAGVDFQVFGSKQYDDYAAGGYHFDTIKIQHNSFSNVELNAIQFGFNWFGDAQGETDSTGKFHEGWEQLWIRDRNLYSTNIYVGHNYAENIGQGVYQFADSKNLLAEYNEGNGWLKRYNGVSAGLYMYASADSVMQYNEIYGGPASQYDATPLDLEFTNFNVTYQYNYTHDNLGGWMSYMGNSGNSIARYNLSVNDNGVIWKNMLSSNYSPTYVSNNVIVYDGSKLTAFHDAVLKDRVYFLNNVFYNTSKTTTTTWETSANALQLGVFSNNDYFEASGKHARDEPIGTNPLQVNPGFVDDPATYSKNAGVANILASAGRFKLSATSPLIDAGRYNAHLGTTDFFGGGNFYGRNPDIGIQEVPVGTKVTDPIDSNPIQDQGVDTRPDLALRKPVTVSSQHVGTGLAAANLTDGSLTTRWAAADTPTYPVTVDINFGTATTFTEVDLTEYVDAGTQPRVGTFSLEKWNPTASTWTSFATGNGIGTSKTVTGFGKITSTKLRLSITGLLSGQTYGPTLSEISVRDTTAVGTPTIAANSTTYDKNPAKANDPSNVVRFTVTGNGDTVQNINYVTPAGAIVQPLSTSDYILSTSGSTSTYTLTRSFYTGKSLGQSGLRFNFISGKSITVAFTIADSSTT